ncbi:SirB2 family protein [Porticoccus sp.]|uniref:SirB2 family protein n=1 Tax=Porticoccus sp. TaxID=2024853 RepID=UPI003F69FD5A
MYLILKNTHVALALLNITLFVVRAVWSVNASPQLQQTWARIVPHIIDTLLLASAVYLMIASQQYPFADNWLTAKLVALLVYIGLGTCAIKRGRTAGSRLLFSLMSVTVFCYIFAVAVTHSPSL